MEKYFGTFFTRPDTTKRPRSEPKTVESTQEKQNKDCPCPSIQNNPTILTNSFVADPGKRLPIFSIGKNAKERENIRRVYLMNGPCQLNLDNFPQILIGDKMRRFNPKWYTEFGSWLEYSESKDAAFCLYCYLFSCEHGDGRGGHDAFVVEGFRYWKDKQKFYKHVGKVGSIHNIYYNAAKDLMDRDQHIDIIMSDISDQAKIDYRIRLNASIECIRFLLCQGLAFRGNDEADDSTNQGNFLELLKFICKHNEEINHVSLKNAPDNLKMIAPSIQKDIVNAAATLTTQAIVADIGDNFFSLIVDEARDVSIKEQMAIALRFVDKKGCIIERFLGIVHVSDTTANSLKEAIDLIFSKHGLSLSNVRGQGYDGASNMCGQFNGLKSLILTENKCAFYVHYFAHQLQLALVACARNVQPLSYFFNYISLLCNVVGASCKRKDILRVKQVQQVIDGIASGDVQTGRGLNQEICLTRPGDTRWGSHYRTLVSLSNLFNPILDVLEIVQKDGPTLEKRTEAYGLIKYLQTFECVLLLNLMIKVLAITNELSQALQRKDQDMMNAMTLVRVSKILLQELRENRWDDLFQKTCDFCAKQEIDVPNMENVLAVQGREKRRFGRVTHIHHFKVEIFYAVIDTQLQELNDRFNDINSKLLLSMACLDTRNSFSAFDKQKFLEFAGFYPSEFDMNNLVILEHQLDTYIVDVRSDLAFSNLQGVAELAKKMVEKRKDVVYPLVYLLVKLALILPVATATVERAFSAMKFIKTALRNRMEDDWLNDCLVAYIEKDVCNTIDNEAIMKYFQEMKPRRMIL